MLNPGTRPATPPIDGLADTPFWTNRDILRTDTLPGVAGGHRRRPDRGRARAGSWPASACRSPCSRSDRTSSVRSSRRPAAVVGGRVRPRGHPGADGHHHRAGLVRRRPVHRLAGGAGGHRREAARRRRAHPQPRRPRPRHGRARPVRAHDRDRRADGRRRRAVGDRRRRRPRGLHAHVDVPVRDRRREHPRQGRPDRRLPRRTPRHLHRSRGRRRRDDREAGTGRRAQRAGRHHRPGRVDPRLDRQGRGPDQARRGRRPRRARRRQRRRPGRRRDPRDAEHRGARRGPDGDARAR